MVCLPLRHPAWEFEYVIPYAQNLFAMRMLGALHLPETRLLSSDKHRSLGPENKNKKTFI